MPEEIDIEGLDVAERPFLHEQGQYVGRGYVVSVSVDDGRWTLKLRDVERLRKSEGVWVPENVFDEFSGPLERTQVTGPSKGFITITGYGSEIILGPRAPDPWLEIDWPELDGYPGGPMGLSGLSKRERKKLLGRLRRRR
jgi:hypothetical protein